MKKIIHKPFTPNVVHTTQKKKKRMYDSQRWRKASRLFLQDNPLCVMCKNSNKITPAYLVDHIIPHLEDYDLFWDNSNWQALCTNCHSAKTIAETRGVSYIYKQTKVDIPTIIICGAPGSGRHSYADKIKTDRTLIISQENIVQELFKVDRYTATDRQYNIALAQQNSIINDAQSRTDIDKIIIIDTLARRHQREKLRKYFNNCEIIILFTNENECIQNTKGLQEDKIRHWHKNYSQGRNEKVIGYG